MIVGRPNPTAPSLLPAVEDYHAELRTLRNTDLAALHANQDSSRRSSHAQRPPAPNLRTTRRHHTVPAVYSLRSSMRCVRACVSCFRSCASMNKPPRRCALVGLDRPAAAHSSPNPPRRALRHSVELNESVYLARNMRCSNGEQDRRQLAQASTNRRSKCRSQ